MSDTKVTCHGCGKDFPWRETVFAADGSPLTEEDAKAMVDGGRWFRVFCVKCNELAEGRDDGVAY